MREGETVGILMDTNMTPPQGDFVEFFGMQACTASGLARVALKTGAAVLPGFMLWEPAERRYVLHFGPEIEFHAQRRRRGQYSGRDPALHRSHRELDSPLSRPVAVDSPPLEDAAGGRAGALLIVTEQD